MATHIIPRTLNPHQSMNPVTAQVQHVMSNSGPSSMLGREAPAYSQNSKGQRPSKPPITEHSGTASARGPCGGLSGNGRIPT